MAEKLTRLAAVAAITVMALSFVAGQNTPQQRGVSKAHHQQVRPRHITPTIPTANRNQPGKVFLEHADSLVMDEHRTIDHMVLYGNVVFRKADMFMYCDSAYFYEEENSLDAFGNVRMQQGDTLFVYGDILNYNGAEEHAILFGGPGRKVRLINRDVKLTTDVFHYDLGLEVGYYNVGGTLSDKLNTLTSLEGEYFPSSKNAYFYYDVRMTSPRDDGDTLRMVTDSLTYNTDTNIARLIAPTVITNKDGRILSSSGTYNTDTGQADLFRRSTVYTNRGNTLTGDTLYYDRNSGIGEAFGNMELTDSANSAIFSGDYGFYNDPVDSAFVTGRALVREFSKGDTLYLHGDTINAYRLPDSLRVTNAFHRVRFYRSDVQGLCDSLSISETDSIMHMFNHPMLFTGRRQVYGNLIDVHFNDSVADWARLPDFGIMSEHVADDCYNQLAGADMTAWMNDSTLRRLYVEGNVQVIMFPMENDSTYNKFVYSESSYMDAYFDNKNIERLTMWPETSGNVTPLYLANPGSYYLPQFKWYGDVLRPVSPEDVFYYPPEMDALMNSQPPGRRKGKNTDKPATESTN